MPGGMQFWAEAVKVKESPPQPLTADERKCFICGRFGYRSGPQQITCSRCDTLYWPEGCDSMNRSRAPNKRKRND